MTTATIERPDGVKVTVSSESSAEVAGLMIALVQTISASADNVPDDTLVDRVTGAVIEALAAAKKRRISSSDSLVYV